MSGFSYQAIAITTLAFAAAFWLASKPSSPQLGLETMVITCLHHKNMSLINRNTKAVLQAIADLHQKTFGILKLGLWSSPHPTRK